MNRLCVTMKNDTTQCPEVAPVDLGAGLSNVGKLTEPFPCTVFAELIYKEVMDWEERSKNGVVKDQPSG